jgi:hypothetical protein
VSDPVPIFQRLFRFLKDCAGQVRETVAVRGADFTLPMVARGKSIYFDVTAARAINAPWPSSDYQIRNAIILSLKQRVELGDRHLMDCFQAGHATLLQLRRLSHEVNCLSTPG